MNFKRPFTASVTWDILPLEDLDPDSIPKQGFDYPFPNMSVLPTDLVQLPIQRAPTELSRKKMKHIST